MHGYCGVAVGKMYSWEAQTALLGLVGKKIEVEVCAGAKVATTLGCKVESRLCLKRPVWKSLKLREMSTTC